MKVGFNKKQNGVALITVMLILALATILAVSMSSRHQLDIHRSANIFNYEQAFQYILGAESWAKQILVRDSQDNKSDSLKDAWATVLPPLPIEGGKMSGEIEDLQARFNINNLVLNGQPQKLHVERFKRLLRNLELDENIAATIIDWIDSDQEMSFSGAEDNEYLNLSPAYRAANQPMQDVSELLLVKGVNFEMYEKLRPYVCVLQSDTPINVNTASLEVISSIVADISQEDAKSIVEDRNKESYENIDGFLQHPILKQKKINKDGLSVNTQYFQLNSTVQIERIDVEYNSVLYRESDGLVTIIKRSQGIL